MATYSEAIERMSGIHEVLEAFKLPLMLLDRRRKIVHANRVLLSIVQPLDAQRELPAIERMFMLTPAEARLAARIAMGGSPASCAGDLNVKISTVRTQLNAIYRKTGARSQAQLVALVLSLAIL